MQKKNAGIQFFNSKTDRFTQIKNNVQLGPGCYKLPEDKGQVFQFAKSEKDCQMLKEVVKKDVPPVGTYTREYKPIEPVQPKSDFPSAFGSGAQRFVNAKSEDCPAPGQYKVL